MLDTCNKNIRKQQKLHSENKDNYDTYGIYSITILNFGNPIILLE